MAEGGFSWPLWMGIPAKDKSLRSIRKEALCSLVLFVSSTISASAIRIQDLPPSYKRWLSEEVVYVITAKERAVFLKLESDRERDLFIEAFWRQRDPVPETPANEFREELYSRIRYANEKLGRGGSKPGWKTDRGRIHIILGKPATVNSYGAESLNLVPIEIWFYQGDFGGGLPSVFYVLFFQDEGLGDYILYSPLRHGPKKLLEAYDGDPDKALNLLLRIDRELADVSRSLIPGQTTVFDSSPALNSEMLLNKISVLPQKRVDDLYAEKLLKYKSLVEVDHSVNYIGNEALLKVIPDGDGRYFVHYAVEPNRLSLGSAEGKYFIRLEVIGKVSDTSGKTVYQYQKEVSLEVDQGHVQEMRAKRFSLQDAFPLIAGRFRFDLLIKNPVSKEFTSFENEVIVPGPLTAPQLGPLILSSARDEQAPAGPRFRPFRVGDAQIFPVANRTFTQSQWLFINFDVFGSTPDLKEAGLLEFTLFKEDQKVLSFTKALQDYPGRNGYFEKVALSPYGPGMYSLTAVLTVPGNTKPSLSKEDFFISLQPNLPEVWSLSEQIPPTDDPYYSHILGTELLNMERIEEAKRLLEEASRERPASLDFALSLAQAYFRSKEYPAVQDLLTRFLEKAGEESLIYDLLGRSSFFQNDFGKAIYFFKKYSSRFGTKLEILNLLAESFYRSGEKEEARSAWKKSLEIEPGQEDIREKLETLEKGPAISGMSLEDVHP